MWLTRFIYFQVWLSCIFYWINLMVFFLLVALSSIIIYLIYTVCICMNVTLRLGVSYLYLIIVINDVFRHRVALQSFRLHAGVPATLWAQWSPSTCCRIIYHLARITSFLGKKQWIIHYYISTAWLRYLIFDAILIAWLDSTLYVLYAWVDSNPRWVRKHHF